VKTWDVIIVGGGIVGVSLALALRRQGAQVLVVDRSEPGREASHAAAGMLACWDHHLPPGLRPLALASAKLYPEFVHELQDESGVHIDYRREGTIAFAFAAASSALPCPEARELSPAEVKELEPGLDLSRVLHIGAADVGLESSARAMRALFLPEHTVNPRGLIASALQAARHRGIEVAAGSPVSEVEISAGAVTGVKTARTRYSAPVVVNCAGAWAAEVAPRRIPTRPVKGQMLAMAPPVSYDAQGTPSSPHLLQHVVRLPDQVYMLPRSDGRVIIGSTLEDAGFDKRVDPETIHHLRQLATQVLPALAEAKILESWAGLRPGTPDHLPILGLTGLPGYFVAAGHYRDGILLAPITARVMAQVICGGNPEFELAPFALARFEKG
jgi:glycine oxidase